MSLKINPITRQPINVDYTHTPRWYLLDNGVNNMSAIPKLVPIANTNQTTFAMGPQLQNPNGTYVPVNTPVSTAITIPSWQVATGMINTPTPTTTPTTTTTTPTPTPTSGLYAHPDWSNLLSHFLSNGNPNTNTNSHLMDTHTNDSQVNIPNPVSNTDEGILGLSMNTWTVLGVIVSALLLLRK